MNENLSAWPFFIELTERRNLFTHCGGIILAQYINVCKVNKVNFDLFDSDIIEGKYLKTTKKYVENAYLILYEIGFKLGQTIYRKLYPERNYLEVADHALINMGVELLKKEQWILAKMVFEYANNLKQHWISDERSKKLFTINLSIALKFSGNNENSLQLLDSIDWSATGTEFVLAVNVLKDKNDEAEKNNGVNGWSTTYQ